MPSSPMATPQSFDLHSLSRVFPMIVRFPAVLFALLITSSAALAWGDEAFEAVAVFLNS